MVRSFRLKISLLSVGISGCVLLAFGLSFVAMIERAGRERIDRELHALADEQLRRPGPPERWALFADSLQAVHEAGAEKQFVVRVSDRHGDLIFVSPLWPQDVPHGELPPMPSSPSAPDWSGGPPLGPLDWGLHPPGHVGPALARGPIGGPPLQRVRGPVYSTVPAGPTYWRIVTMGDDEAIVSIGVDLAVARAEARKFRAAFLVAFGLAVLLLTGGGWVLAQVALRPVQVIARTAENMTARQLDQRIPGTDADEEFAQLIVVINGMLERLERSFQQAVRFSADAAHELKTPLAILQGGLERALQAAEDGSVEQRTYTEWLEEVQRLKAIVRKLLLLAQADSGQLKLARSRVNMTEIVRAICEDLGILAPTAKLAVDVPSAVWVLGDVDLLNQVFQNLATNATKFNDERAVVSMTLRSAGSRAEFSISNTGPGIPLADQGRIFERFYRGDKSRGRRVDGAGLGLSLAREIARAHGGDLVLVQSDAQLTTFALTLPMAGDAPASDDWRRG